MTVTKQHFYSLAAHAAGNALTADENVKGFTGAADLQRMLGILETRQSFGERDFQAFIRYCRACSDSAGAEFEWQKQKVVGEWGYPRGVFCIAADNGRPFEKASNDLASLFGF